jgi:hypothetical protein
MGHFWEEDKTIPIFAWGQKIQDERKMPICVALELIIATIFQHLPCASNFKYVLPLDV